MTISTGARPPALVCVHRCDLRSPKGDCHEGKELNDLIKGVVDR